MKGRRAQNWPAQPKSQISGYLRTWLDLFRENERIKQLVDVHRTVIKVFFYYKSYIGLTVKWKVHNGGFILNIFLKATILMSFSP